MSKLTALSGFLFMTMSYVWAQTPPTTPGSPPAEDAGTAGDGIADYWWLIVLAIIVIAAIVYFPGVEGACERACTKRNVSERQQEL